MAFRPSHTSPAAAKPMFCKSYEPRELSPLPGGAVRKLQPLRAPSSAALGAPQPGDPPFIHLTPLSPGSSSSTRQPSSGASARAQPARGLNLGQGGAGIPGTPGLPSSDGPSEAAEGYRRSPGTATPTTGAGGTPGRCLGPGAALARPPPQPGPAPAAPEEAER